MVGCAKFVFAHAGNHELISSGLRPKIPAELGTSYRPPELLIEDIRKVKIQRAYIMSNKAKSIAWDLFSDLRKELVELQKIRSHIIGFKIAFVSSGIGLVVANIDKVSNFLFVIPAFAAVFFDLLIHSYSFSIKRTGFYCRKYLEPILRNEYELSEEYLFWEEFMASPEAGKNVSFWGNLGITFLAVVPAIIALFAPFDLFISPFLGACLLAVLIYDIVALYKPIVFSKELVYYKNPRPCVAIFIVENNKVLLALRAIEPAKGKWDIPGGFINPGESAEKAVVREAEEETSLKVSITGFLGSLPDVYGNKKVPTLNLCFIAEIVEGEPHPRDDVAALEWFPLERLPLKMAFAHQYKMLLWCRNRLNRP